MHRYLAAASLNGAMGVALGSWAAHGLEGRLTPEALDWIHTGGKKLKLADLRGKIVFLDFWTYG